MKYKQHLTPLEAAQLSSGLSGFESIEQLRDYLSMELSTPPRTFSEEERWDGLELEAEREHEEFCSSAHQAIEIYEAIEAEISRLTHSKILEPPFQIEDTPLIISSISLKNNMPDPTTITLTRHSISLWLYLLGETKLAEIFHPSPETLKETKSLKVKNTHENLNTSQSTIQTDKLAPFIRQLIGIIDPSIKPDAKGTAIINALNKKLPGEEVINISDKTLTKYLDL